LLQYRAIKNLPFNEEGLLKLADEMVQAGDSPENIAKELAAKLKPIKKHFKFLESAIRDAEGSPAGKEAITLALKTSGHLQPDVSDTATKISQKVTDVASSIADAPGSAWKAGKKALGMAEQKRLTREQLKKIIMEEMSALGRPWDDWSEEERGNIEKGWASARGPEDIERLQQEAAGLAVEARQAVQRALMMDEALPGEDEWLESEMAEVLGEYLRKWRKRK